MADQKISQLTDGTSFQAGDEAVVNRSGTNFKVDPTQFGSSIDVTGTVTADDLIASDGDGGTVSIIRDDATVGIDNSLGNITWYSTEDGGSTINQGASIIALAEQNHSTVASGSRLVLTTTPIGSTTTLNRLLISNNGDISFYEDTGTTPKFFWDASAESLGIGTTSPSTRLHLYGSDANLTIQDDNNFGDQRIKFLNGSSSVISQIVAPSTVPGLQFYYGVLEAMRIDSSGNLLVGTTDDTPSANNDSGGAALIGSGQLNVSRDGAVALDLNRKTSDGAIALFRKDGTQVGNIGAEGGNLYVDGSASTGKSGIEFSGSEWLPRDTGANSDAVISLGDGSNRFKDLYLSGGVYLGGTAAANLLDDYETGTWTPEVADAATGGNTGTYTLDAGSAVYTKIGNLVTISAILRNIDTSGMTSGNTFYIRGLPFVVNKRTFGAVQVDNVTFTDSICSDSKPGTASIEFIEANSGTTGAQIKVNDVTSGSGSFLFSTSYFVA